MGRYAFIAATVLCCVPQSALANQATVHVIWPCHLADHVLSESLKPDYGIAVDGKLRIKITTCHHKKFTVPAGSHGFRLQQPGIDIGGIFGDDIKVKLAPGDQLYLGVISTYGGGGFLKDVGPTDGKAAIQAIKNF